VSFKNTIIIMTSNVGSSMILENGEDENKLKDMMMQELRRHFRPEFLNRIDETLIFHSLKREDIRRIVALQMDILAGRLADKEIKLEMSDAALDLIAEVGYDPDFGARPLKRAIISMVETPLSRKMIAGELSENSRLLIDAEHEELLFKVLDNVTC
jgi:ATP-dependent Clp protease ATP-binding subunit ClpB